MCKQTQRCHGQRLVKKVFCKFSKDCSPIFILTPRCLPRNQAPRCRRHRIVLYDTAESTVLYMTPRSLLYIPELKRSSPIVFSHLSTKFELGYQAIGLRLKRLSIDCFKNSCVLFQKGEERERQERVQYFPQSGTIRYCTVYSTVHSHSFVVVVHNNNRCRELENGYTYCIHSVIKTIWICPVFEF